MYQKTFCILTILVILALSQTLFAEVSATLNFQGVLREPSGRAVEDGDYKLVFKIYNHETSGDIKWTETHPAIEIKNGIANVVLGSVTPLEIPFDEDYWVGVSVDDGSELTPRTRLTTAPYAMSLRGTDNTFPGSGNVGVGTTTPTSELEVAGRIKDKTGFVMPVGTVLPYAGGSAPEGWLICSGQALNGTVNPEYHDLFVVIGTTFGGTGESSFNVPYLGGRNVLGVGNGYLLAGNGGNPTHQLTDNQLPAHTHDCATTGAHTHTTDIRVDGGFTTGGSANALDDDDGGYDSLLSHTSSSDGNHTHTISGGGNGTANGDAHNILDPYLVLNFIIKY